MKVERFIFGNVNIAKIYERLLSTNISEEKRRDSFDARSLNLLSEDSIWMVNRLKIPRMIDCCVFFLFLFYYLIALPRLFQKMSCVLSSEHENQNFANIGLLLDHIHVDL